MYKFYLDMLHFDQGTKQSSGEYHNAEKTQKKNLVSILVKLSAKDCAKLVPIIEIKH